MAACKPTLTGGIIRDCLEKNVGGVETDMILFNSEDIDRTATTFSIVNDCICTALVLKTGKVGFPLVGIKQVNAMKFELVKKDLSEDAWKHTISVIVPNVSAANKQRLTEMVGNKMVVAAQTKFKGLLQKDAFHLVGYESGLELLTATYASNEADGTVAIELASADGYEEPRPIATILETDYATTLTAFEALFVAD